MTAFDPQVAYARARDAVLRIKGGGPAEAGPHEALPSAYWADELSNIDYMIEASPLVLAKLRHHAFHITGIRPYDYRDKGDGRRGHFEARLAALRALGGDRLLVPEHPALGGFGYEIDGRLFNVDTLKFYEVLIGMERGGVLADIRGAARPVVCEIGAGWGGFAYQFKTLFPHATYVIVDFPELFLFSATYLGTLFPGARLMFCEGNALPDGWQQADVLFVPHTRADLVRSMPLALTLNMVSFQEMTDAQVRAYADSAAASGCPLIYSFNRERSPYNTEIASVRAALADRYALREIDVLDSDYTAAMKATSKRSAKGAHGYRHVVGRRRPDGPRVALGMTLHNNAAHLPEALESILAQSHADFRLVMVDDGSSDQTEAIARAWAERDARISYHRRDRRAGMIATWREAAAIARRECPSAEYFAWVSDHDRWHPQWLARLVAELDAAPEAVLAYPITQRVTPEGEAIEKKEPRLFDTAGMRDLRTRWNHFCANGVGAGDMVYGLMRLDALEAAGVFREVLRPDRLVIAELVLRGEVRQAPEVLWFRRNNPSASVVRQRHSLLLPGTEPSWFWWPPFLQHTTMLRRTYGAATLAALAIDAAEWQRMLRRYQLTYGWRHVKKTDTSTAIGRGIERVIYGWKMLKHYYRHAVYHVLVAIHGAWDRIRGEQA